MKSKINFKILILLIIFISISIIYYRERKINQPIRKELQKIRQQVEELKKENEQLKERIKYLSHPLNLEKELKENFNLAQEKEKVIFIKPEIINTSSKYSLIESFLKKIKFDKIF